MKTISLLLTFGYLSLTLVDAQVTNSSYTTQYNEKVLQLSIILPMDKKETWKLFTTVEGLKKWISPVVAIDMRTGGSIRTNYDKTKTIEDSSSIKLDIINYLEYEMLTLKVNLNNNFSIETQESDENLQEVIQFLEVKKGKTKIISSMIGWGQGDEWNKVYTFFEQGNEWSYQEMLKLFSK